MALEIPSKLFLNNHKEGVGQNHRPARKQLNPYRQLVGCLLKPGIFGGIERQ
jgi:hypothetical protein